VDGEYEQVNRMDAHDVGISQDCPRRSVFARIYEFAMDKVEIIQTIGKTIKTVYASRMACRTVLWTRSAAQPACARLLGRHGEGSGRHAALTWIALRCLTSRSPESPRYGFRSHSLIANGRCFAPEAQALFAGPCFRLFTAMAKYPQLWQ
jgi:hypothetical protein